MMKTLALVSQKGGAGKTTLALHLALAAHQAGYQTAIVDLDPQASAWKWSQRRKAPPEAVGASPEQLESIKAKAQAGGLDILILDSAPNADRASLIACKAADLVLIPCQASILDIDAIGASYDLTEIARKPACIVFNKCSTLTDRDEIESREGMKKRNVEVCPDILHDLVIFKRSLIVGRTATEMEPISNAAKEVKSLFSWVEDRLDLHSKAMRRKAC